MRHLTTGLVILGFLAGSAIAEQDPFLGYPGPVYPNPISRGIPPPWVVVEGDFNEDGIEDYAVRRDYTRVLIGNGDGTFESSGTGLGFAGPGMAVGDFNEDGHQDLAVDKASPGIQVALGNGDGTFGAPATFDAPTIPNLYSYSIAVGDFDEDGHEDVVVALSGTFGFAFFSGNGDGTFDEGIGFSSGNNREFAVADFNHDNHLELIGGYDVGCRPPNNCNPSTPAKVRLGTGTGAFVDGGTYDVGGGPYDYVASDFNDDTHIDFASANLGSEDVSVRLGNGDGTFGAETTYDVGPEPYFLVVGDVDSDGNADILVSHQEERYVSLLTGNGDGTFDSEVQVPSLHQPHPMLLSDLDDDGYLDLVVASLYQGTFFVMPGLGDGTFAWPDPALVLSAGPGGGVAAALGDLDNDGLQDVAIVRDDGMNSLTVRLADGDGAFSVSATADPASVPTAVAIAEVTSDANLDVIVPTTINKMAVFAGNGDGTLDPPTFVAQEAVVITTGLFDADANVDLAAVTTSGGPQIDILLGNGNATFAPGVSYGVASGPSGIATSDFNEDNNTDLVVFGGDFPYEMSVLLGEGDGTFQPEVRYPGYGSSVVDANEDGHQDLALVVGSNVLYGVGDGTFGAATPLDSGVSGFLVAADANGDGRTDHVGVHNAYVQLALRQEDGSFASPETSGSWGFGSVIVEDTNGDGRNDVIVGAWATGGQDAGVIVLLNVEPTPFNFAADKATMNWPAVTGALSYNVYRGLISSLVDGDSDGLPDAGYGDCQNALDPDTTDLHYVDASIPPAGDGYFYLIAVVDWAGERYLGRTSDGLARFPGTPCP